MTVVVGCCGFPKARGQYYQRFRAVEVQSTFYRLPQERTAARWRAEAPEGFIFTMKAWQLITHPASSPTYRRLGFDLPREERAAYGSFQPTPQVWEAWEATRRVAALLDAVAVVFQTPPSFTPTEANIAHLRAFFARAERDGRLFVWEPRGPWPDDLVARLCRELDLIHGVDPLERWPVTQGTAYFRLHGRALGRGRYAYRHRYSDAELLRLREIVAEYPQAFVFFNNVYMWEDAQRFQKLLEG